MQHLIAEKKQETGPQPIRGFPWLLIGADELLVFGGFVVLSWLASSALLYALEASLFLVAVGLLHMFLVLFIFHGTSPLKERLLVSCRLLPSGQDLGGLIALAHFVVAALCVGLVILGSQLGVLAFPGYWWDMGSRFLLMSADLSLLFPRDLRAMTVQGKGALTVRWFLAGWTLLISGWLIGGLLDFDLGFFPPKLVLVCSWTALLILLTMYWTYFCRFQREEEPSVTEA
ncbi:MAG: hypothetical protein H0W02_07480 [Ktedonobacteraceae bacterium]|nr:hypothetical protein [Ktedonobacteraceae bacterium]